MSLAAHPNIVSREDWLAARRALLDREKEVMRQNDALSAARRRLPMVRIDQEYVFERPGGGTATLLDLFEGRRQLIVYHFMFDPGDPPPGKSEPWTEGCRGCSFVADNLPHLSHLHARVTTLVMVSRAPQAKIRPFQARMGWTVPWYSSFGGRFNYDFHVTTDPTVAPVEYNYKDAATLEREGLTYHLRGEQPGLSTFLRLDREVFHCYSTYGRGLEAMLTTSHLLDLTALGRQEGWEDSPPGWPRDTEGGQDWVRHHDRYDAAATGSCCH